MLSWHFIIRVRETLNKAKFPIFQYLLMMDDCPLTEIGVRCLGLAGSLWFGGGVDLPFFTPSTGLIQSNS